MSDPMTVDPTVSSGITAVQARIAAIASQFGSSTTSFQSVLASAAAATDDTSATDDATSTGDTDVASALSAVTGDDDSSDTGTSALAKALGLASAASSGSTSSTGTSSTRTSPTSASSGVSVSTGTHSSRLNADKVIAEAKKYLGVKYVWGGESPSGFDCSGLVQYVYGKFGVNLPRVAADQAHTGTAVSAAQAKPGDLVFFHKPASHVGIYLGNGMMLDSPNSKSHVRIEKVWSGVSGYRRVLPTSSSSVAAAGSTSSSGTTSSSVSALAAKLPAAGKQYAAAITSAAKKYGIDPKLLAAVAWTESGFKAHAVSPAGAQGLMQLMPATARGLGVNALNPTQALEGGAKYLKSQLQKFGRTDLALAAYNAGPSAVRKYGGVPPYSETQHYVRTVQTKMATLAAKAA